MRASEPPVVLVPVGNQLEQAGEQPCPALAVASTIATCICHVVVVATFTSHNVVAVATYTYHDVVVVATCTCHDVVVATYTCHDVVAVATCTSHVVATATCDREPIRGDCEGLSGTVRIGPQ